MAALSYQMLAGPGVSPQALSQPSMQTGVIVTAQNTATGLKNVYMDPSAHLQVLYAPGETPYKSNMVCPSGTASVNNECLCPGAPSGVPYRVGVPSFSNQYVNTLFSPIQTDMFPQLSPAAKALISERGPCPASAYRPLDMTPLTACMPSKCT